ncbi:LOW QUALITY PROTEIN: hypothetical protein U9M48_001400 [Paspalum notatum var. saurae]|uniref:Protein kinase domain-containing protein n=1 Tax=Paspalum notatum var. saurae TaxID=547442 RepID=A0AAQ3PLX5_PASNO
MSRTQAAAARRRGGTAATTPSPSPPRCVLDGDTTTTSTATSTGTNSSTAACTEYYPSTLPLSAPPPAARQDDDAVVGPSPPPWKSVADKWRSRAKRQLSGRIIPSLGPTMSSTLLRLQTTIRRAADQTTTTTTAAGAHEEFCVLKPTLRTFTLAELKKATRNFSKDNVVGRGGFAKVYKGSLPGGELVAVKKLLTAAAQGGAQERTEGFLAELGHVVNVSHPNIARLVGVGVDGGEHLVFPFSRLGCLSGMLHGGGGGGGAAEPMPWEARYRVAVGTARGLEYLHERGARRIVHRDIKPANILLMDNYEPLICDFGLARWLPAKLTHLQVTVFEGTFGYVPPEYTTHGVFSEKTDVFSLGVVLLELLTGRRAIDAAKLSLVSWARQYLDDGVEEDEVPKMADPALGGRYDGAQLRDMAWAAKLCVHASPDHRPQMSEVVRILTGGGGEDNNGTTTTTTRRRSPRGEAPRGGADQHHHHPPAGGGDGEPQQETTTTTDHRLEDDLSRHKALAFDFDGESCSCTPRTYTSSSSTLAAVQL